MDKVQHHQVALDYLATLLDWSDVNATTRALGRINRYLGEQA